MTSFDAWWATQEEMWKGFGDTYTTRSELVTTEYAMIQSAARLAWEAAKEESQNEIGYMRSAIDTLTDILDCAMAKWEEWGKQYMPNQFLEPERQDQRVKEEPVTAVSTGWHQQDFVTKG